MEEQSQLSPEVLQRLQAWTVCLDDALAYIALARDQTEYARTNAFFMYKGGQREVGYTLDKALIAAAIVSVGQVVKSGREGRHIAGNRDPVLGNLRRLLYLCSDHENGWVEGKTATLVTQLVEAERDSFLAHFDGDKSAIKFDERGNEFWRPPNPHYRPDAFTDLEAGLHQMLRALRATIASHGQTTE